MAPKHWDEPKAAHILLVEDDVLMRTTVAAALRSSGFVVIEAAHVGEACCFIEAGG